MAKKIKTIVKLQVEGGRATPAPPVGTALGPHGINLQQFVLQFNEATKQSMGQVTPVEITIYEDRTFDFKLKTPPASYLLRVAAGIEKGSGVPNKDKVGKVTKEYIDSRFKELERNLKSHTDREVRILKTLIKDLVVKLASIVYKSHENISARLDLTEEVKSLNKRVDRAEKVLNVKN